MAARAEPLDHAVPADEVQRADDDKIAAAVFEQPLELVGPGGVALGHERRIELGVIVEVAEQLVRHRFEVSVAPRGRELFHRRVGGVELVERLL